MPLSRHFYSLDEVLSSLLYTTSHNTPGEALFWCQELVLSGSISEAISTLFQSWLWHTGPMRLQWLVNVWRSSLITEELTEDDILLATYRLAAIHQNQRDNSLWNILVLTMENPSKMPDRVTRKTPPICDEIVDKKELYFIRAMFQGKARSAWWISQYLAVDRVWVLLNWFLKNIPSVFKEEYKVCLEALQNYELLLGYKSAEYDIIVRCAAINMMCIPHKRQELSFKVEPEIDMRNAQILNELELSVGRRERRVHKIPTACLYGTTVRGRLNWTQNNYTQLYNIEKYLIGCPFWDEVILKYANVLNSGTIQWHSNDTMEKFYDKYFPDDIPDEWTLLDQQQSHGDGILGPTDKVKLSKWSRTFMSKLPHLAWNTTKATNIYLEKLDISDSTDRSIGDSIDKLFENYKTESILPFSEDALEPVKKIKIAS
jgi:hypothetical protein